MSPIRHATPMGGLGTLGVLTAAALLSACASAPLPPAASTPTSASSAAAAAGPAAGVAASGSAVRTPGTGTSSSLPAQTATPGSPAQPAAAATAGRSTAPTAPQATSVYFAFDDFTLDNPAGLVVEQYGRWMTAQPAARLRVEGHADERGGREYNLALGHKRAQAVVNALRLQGVVPAALEAVSFGKERPRALGHDEAAWAQNRRADLVLR